MALDTDIATAIDNDLPNQVGQRLKQRLEQAEADAKEVQTLRRANDDLNRMQRRWDDSQRREQELEEREKNVTSQEKVLARREVTCEVKEEFMEKRLQDMMTLTTQVFKGPASKMAFDLWGNLNGLMSDNGYASNPTASLSGSLDAGAEK